VSTETTDVPICGWKEPDRSMCVQPRHGKRCTRHEEPQFTVCVGCAGAPDRTCGPTCMSPICPDCHHHPDGTHSQEEPGPFAAQRPLDPSNHVRKQMIAVVAEALVRCSMRGMCTFPEDELVERVAGVIVDHQATKALMTLQEGLAAVQAQQGGS
jgi:hypothetical protein